MRSRLGRARRGGIGRAGDPLSSGRTISLTRGTAGPRPADDSAGTAAYDPAVRRPDKERAMHTIAAGEPPLSPETIGRAPSNFDAPVPIVAFDELVRRKAAAQA